jgi:hypothetical protein
MKSGMYRLRPAPSNEVKEEDRSHPMDYLHCQNRFPRLVVACMNHCPFGENYCKTFFNFFEEQRISPSEYFNQDGVGDKVMRRIVFDCDRCGKKEIPKVMSRYLDGCASDKHVLSDEEMADAILEQGYHFAGVGEAVIYMMCLMERQNQWIHLCETCFGRLTLQIGKFLKTKPFITQEVADDTPMPVARAKRSKRAKAASKANPKTVRPTNGAVVKDDATASTA